MITEDAILNFIGNWFQCFPVYSSLNLSSGSVSVSISGSWSRFRIPDSGFSIRPQWPLAPNFCSWATRKSQIFHTNHMLSTLDFTGSEHWAPFNFPESTALPPVHGPCYKPGPWTIVRTGPWTPLYGPLIKGQQ